MLKQSLLVSTLIVTPLALANDFFGDVQTRTQRQAEADSAWSHRGWVQQSVGYGYRDPAPGFARDSADLTRVETRVYNRLNWRDGPWQLRLSGSLLHDWLPDAERWGLWSGYEFTPEQRDSRRWRLELSDSYLDWQRDDWWLRGGYQTLAWGESETVRVTDVLARRDQRWPGQEDLEDLRLPVPAVQLTWRNQLDMVLLGHTAPDRLPAAGEEFDPYIQLHNLPQAPELHLERRNSPGWALRWRQRWPGVDAQLMLANVHSHDRAPERMLPGDDANPPPEHIHLTPWRQQVLGGALQTVRGSWLFRSEQALFRGVRLEPNDPLGPWPERDQWRGMLGAEYAGFRNLTLTSEISGQYTRGDSDELADSTWQPGGMLRARYTLFNERLTLSGLAIRLAGDNGRVLRLNADWDYSDSLTLGLALVEYSGPKPDQLLHPYRHNDTLLLSLRWNL